MASIISELLLARIFTFHLQSELIVTYGASWKIPDIIGLLALGFTLFALSIGRPYLTWHARIYRPLVAMVLVIVFSTIQTFVHLDEMKNSVVLARYTGGRNSPELRSLMTTCWGIFSLLLVIISVHWIKDIRLLKKLLVTYIISSSLVAGYGIYQFLSFNFFDLPLIPGFRIYNSSVNWVFSRPFSTYSESATLSESLLVSIPISIAILKMNILPRLTSLFFILIQVLALFCAFSVGALISFFSGVIICIPILYKYRIKVGKGIKVFVVLIIITAIVGSKTGDVSLDSIYGNLQARIFGFGESESRSDRMTLFLIAWEIFKKNPILGVGIGNYGFLYSKYLGVIGNPMRSITLISPSNLYSAILAETGFIGMLSFVWIIITFYRTQHRMISSSCIDNGLRFLTVGTSCSMLFLLINFNFLDNVMTPSFWLLISLFGIVYNLHKKQLKSSSLMNS